MIEVESAPGRGATFRILLPQIDFPVEHAGAAIAESAAAGGSETILLVEDEDMVRALAKDILTMNGYKVLEAAHGNAALDLSRVYDGPIALMLTDVVMPSMNGHELYERLAPLRPGMKVLYMSGYAESGIVHDGAIDPGTAFIAKPFSPDALAARVRQILDRVGNN
jgi:DNA-binding response OmpR family regulator